MVTGALSSSSKSKLLVEEIPYQTNSEIVTIKVETHDKPVIIFSCYKSPNYIGGNYSFFTYNIKNLCKRLKNCPLWLGGDFQSSKYIA